MRIRPPRVSVFDASRPVTIDDVRELGAFLQSHQTNNERALHELLENHPALVGVLGFSEFASEQPLYKRDHDNKVILLDPHRRDRADIVAAKSSIIRTSPAGTSYRSVHIIELKSAASPISERGYGLRLSEDANRAVNQLREYKQWLETVPENRQLFASVGWDIRVPMRYLVMGTATEFANNPGHLDELRGRLLEDGVCLVTVDELLLSADKLARARTLLPDVTSWTISSDEPASLASPRVLIQLDEFALLHPTSVRFSRSAGPEIPPGIRHDEFPRSLRRAILLQLRRDFVGLCAYCRTPDRLLGGLEAFGLETFRPRMRFPTLATSYSNFLYACRTCNNIKAASWPTAAEEQAGYTFVDPTERFEEHFEETADYRWHPKTRAAEYTYSHLKLDRDSLIQSRMMLRQIGASDGRV